MKTILVVNTNWLGDAVFSSPVFYALKQKYADARIICLADPRTEPVLECIDAIDEVIEYDEKGAHKSLLGKLKVIHQIRRQRCDAAFFVHGSSTKALMVMLAGIKVRVGCPIKKKQHFLTHSYMPLKDVRHRSDLYLQGVKQHGVGVSHVHTKLRPNEDSVQLIKNKLHIQGVMESDFLVGINIGANWDLKRWPVENFRKLIIQLLAHDQKVVITGANKDASDINKMLKGISDKGVINLTARTNLKELISLLSIINVFVCADSGPLHIANSLGTPVVGLYGPTRPEVTGPVGVGRSRVLIADVGCNRQPCYFDQCPDNLCMQAVTVQDVFNSVQEIKNEKQ